MQQQPFPSFSFFSFLKSDSSLIGFKNYLSLLPGHDCLIPERVLHDWLQMKGRYFKFQRLEAE